MVGAEVQAAVYSIVIELKMAPLFSLLAITKEDKFNPDFVIVVQLL